VRRVLLTIAVACVVAASAMTAGWGLQAAILPPPARSARVAASAVSWLLRSGLVESAFRIGRGPLVRSDCLQGWPTVTRSRSQSQAAVLVLSSGGTLVYMRPGLRVFGAGGDEPSPLPLVQLELGGCANIVAPRIAGVVQTSRLRVERSFAAGHPALAIVVPTHATRLTVYVTPRTFKPFAIRVDSPRYSGRGRIRLIGPAPAPPARPGEVVAE
jgi:hypothetical protein